MSNETQLEPFDPVKRINAILDRYRVTQQEIASEVGINPATLSAFLVGHRKPSEVVHRALTRWVDENSYRYPLDGVPE